jgi:hypothetical protein
MHPRDRTSLLPLLRVYPIADDAAQTFGGNFESDGRPFGTLDIKSVQCDTPAQRNSTGRTRCISSTHDSLPRYARLISCVPQTG